ncbi:GON-4-like protein [Anthonomus grandis grandis]|uniref:GON-4-like protein n=1 Tax=Anthonomus grandis grandis TaxID=2921223 RepID=UPI0021656EE1|nr:GON-4-like protein [Anthonomus grandis grandis]
MSLKPNQMSHNKTSSPLKPSKETRGPAEHSDGDGDLEIVLPESPPKRSPRKSPIKIDPKVVETIEDEIEEELKKKAEKSNLTVHNVKSIIRQVLTNEHVRAMLENNASDDESPEMVPFEPKLTRAKAKELYSSNSSPVNIPWVPVPPPSETHVLIGEDLKEDDSGDEYVPGEDESEDENNESCASESDVNSLPPPTPPTICTEDQSTQTTELTYTDDGVFKIPPPKSLQEEAADEVANIALRTRSKINLSSTPLEVIEESFIPPDITTDMYDMECDDDDWKEFLKGFTKPLEELTKPTEDEEHDPEYDYLADDDKNLLDKEDLRIDKAVKITKKEVKELWEEVFDYLHNLSCEYDEKYQSQEQTAIQEMLNSSLANIGPDISCVGLDNSVQVEEKKSIFDLKLTYQQLCIIEQQMRQHVQMLAQNFLLTFEHPEYHEFSRQVKEYLLNLKYLGEGRTYSVFRPSNLLLALEVVDSWAKLFETNCSEVIDTRRHVQQELSKSLHYKMAGNWQYILTFPKLILETVSKSEVFTYPSLLPQIPFKSEQFFGSKSRFSDAEERLLAFGLDQFKTFLLGTEKGKKVHLNDVIGHVQEHMMPHRTKGSILKHIVKTKHPRCVTNPIQQYFMLNKVKPVVHYIYPLDQLVAPCKRLPEELPAQWRDFVNVRWGNVFANQNVLNLPTVIPQQYIIIKTPLTNSSLTPLITTSPFVIQAQPTRTPKKSAKKAKTNLAKAFDAAVKHDYPNKTSQNSPKSQLKRADLNSSLTSIEQFVSIFLRPIPIQHLVRFLMDLNNKPARVNRVFVSSNMLSMPSLSTPLKAMEDNAEEPNVDNKRPETVTSSSTVINQDRKEKVSKNLEFLTITNSSFQKENTSSEVEFSTELNSIQISQILQSEEADGPGGGSSGYSSSGTVKNNSTQNSTTLAKSNTKKEPTVPKKKGIKIKKDFLANLAIASPADPESEKHKNELFAIAYYDKLRETLDLEDYHKLMQVLNDFGSGDVIDLYKDVQGILQPKYTELAEEFLLFLREKEAMAVGQLMPWLEMQARTRFLRKLEIFLKDQPGQLKKIYNSLMELSKDKDVTKEKVKSVLLPMLKGNSLLYDLLMQNFKDEPPTESLLSGPYETIDINKELARPEGEEIFETFAVPNDEDKYGGQNCICHCHRIEDKEYKSRAKHCANCGLKFVNGKLYLAAGRSFQPATVTFRTSPHTNHNARLMTKHATAPSNSMHKKKRCDSSPNKIAGSSGKENVEEDTEEDEPRKRKRSVSQKTPKKRRKTGEAAAPPKASSPPKKSLRKRTYSSKTRTKKEEINKTEEEEGEEEEEEEEGESDNFKEEEAREEKTEEEEFEIVAELEESEHETSEERAEKSLDDCMDSSGESLEKPSSPGQQTAESESEIYQEESSQDNYESDDSTTSEESTKGSQSDTDEPPWRREEDTIILETLQKEDDKEYALQIIAERLPSRTVGQIRNRLTRLMDLLIETLRTT